MSRRRAYVAERSATVVDLPGGGYRLDWCGGDPILYGQEHAANHAGMRWVAHGIDPRTSRTLERIPPVRARPDGSIPGLWA